MLALAAALLPGASRDPLEGYVPVGPAQRCINPTINESTVILDRQTVGVRRSARSWWVSRIDHCPSLEPLSTLIVERFGGQICNTDRFRVLSPQQTIPSAFCRFGSFTRYDRPARKN